MFLTADQPRVIVFCSMPSQQTNGVHHGRGDGVLETAHTDTFLFTSESVGEGHPGKFYF